ncbi:MAG TPA: response regulator [Bacteroidota bacterium]|nr:response regulator [Bacteroidota bacterium]
MHTRTLLIVEDEAIIAAAESLLFRNNGYAVMTALSAEEALAAVRSRAAKPDLVLMDIDLGRGKDGTEAAREMLREGEVPILFISSLAEREILVRTRDIPSCGYVLKNAGEAALLAAVRSALTSRGEPERVGAEFAR